MSRIGKSIEIEATLVVTRNKTSGVTTSRKRQATNPPLESVERATLLTP